MDSDSWQLAAGWREREGRLPNLDVDAFRRAGRYLDTAVLDHSTAGAFWRVGYLEVVPKAPKIESRVHI